MSIEFLHAQTPEVLTAGTYVHKCEEPVQAPFALLFTSCGEGACIEGTREELLTMLEGARTALGAQPAIPQTLASHRPATTPDQQEALEELVHDQASQQASNAINAGDGWDFLRASGWSDTQIRERIGIDS